jgi:hypothetical protein
MEVPTAGLALLRLFCCVEAFRRRNRAQQRSLPSRRGKQALEFPTVRAGCPGRPELNIPLATSPAGRTGGRARSRT